MSRHPTINFRTEFIGAIRRGDKTQTRRPIRYSKLVDKRRVMRPCPWQVGELYEVVATDEQRVAWADLTQEEQRGYRKRAKTLEITAEPPWQIVNRPTATPTGWFVRVTATRLEALIDVSDDDLIAEGFEDDREGFIEWMAAHYGEHIETVWVAEFEREIDVPMFLAKQAGYMHPEQYTRNVGEAIDQGEIMGGAELASFAEHNRAKDTLRRLERNADALTDTKELEDELAAVRRLAREQGLNIRSTERLIGRKIAEIKKQLRDAA